MTRGILVLGLWLGAMVQPVQCQSAAPGSIAGRYTVLDITITIDTGVTLHRRGSNIEAFKIYADLDAAFKKIPQGTRYTVCTVTAQETHVVLRLADGSLKDQILSQSTSPTPPAQNCYTVLK